MRKQKYFIIAVLFTLALTGCKKREAVDLSSLHTTEAVERETLESSEGPSSVESEESQESSGASENSVSTGGSQYSFKTELKTAVEGGASVEYPLLSNLKDDVKEKKVNDLLKNNALGVVGSHPLAAGQTLSVKASVESANLKRITVTYKGELKSSGASAGQKTSRFFYSNTIDLNSMTSLGLGDFADPYTVAGYIASGDYKLEGVSGGNEQAIRSYLNSPERTVEYYYELLSGADFSGGYGSDGKMAEYTAKNWPSVFSYEKHGVIYVSVPVSEELGGYVLIKYNPDNK